MSHRRCRDEAGSSLIIALAFLSLFGLFVAALLSFGESSLMTSKEMRTLGDQFYDADAGLDGAINWLRAESSIGTEGVPCPDFKLNTPRSTNPAIPAVRVACTPNPGSGEVVGRDTTLNTPGQAILTLGTNAGEGILVSGSKDLNVEGSAYSNGKMALGSTGQKMNIQGDVIAMAGCSSNVIMLPPGTIRNCASPAPVADPAYPALKDLTAATFAAMPRHDLVTQTNLCNNQSRVIPFEPGYYDDAKKLSWLTNAGTPASPCGKTSIFWFKPGMYYFDFNFQSTGSCALSTDGACTWEIAVPLNPSHNAKGSVLGGTPQGWNPASPPANRLDLGSCQKDVETANNGVQFVFGGESRLKISAGVVELCAQGSATTQQILFYGLRSGSLSAEPPVVAQPAAASSAGNSFSPQAEAMFIDDAPASALVSAADPSAAVRLDLPAISIPAGARIDSAKLTIRHGERSGDNLTELQLGATMSSPTFPAVTVTSSECTSDPSQAVLCEEASGALRDDVIDLRARGLDTPAEFASGLAVDYTASVPTTAANPAQELLDGMTLTVQYTKPGFRKPADGGCLVKAPYAGGDSTTCPLLQVTGNNVRGSLEGTVYTPLTAIDVNLPNDSRAFGRGLISRTASIGVPSSFSFTGSPLRVPRASAAGVPAGTTAPRAVTLVAAVWDARKNAYVNRARAVVEFPAGAPVQVRSWNVLR